uniref:Histone-lysine N-methyltransferase 2D n=1 Tax=Cacopsylla melanoneura TaxID=428564 RepID=A0A8D8R7Z5_9HEMI
MADDPDWAPKQDMSLLCRVCANQHDYLIPIFEGEGLDHDMPTKMEKHLPIKVRENDKLPTQMCYQCASTIIAWSDLHTNCLEADKKLTRMLRINEKKSASAAGLDDDGGSDHYEDAYDAGGGGGGDETRLHPQQQQPDPPVVGSSQQDGVGGVTMLRPPHQGQVTFGPGQVPRLNPLGGPGQTRLAQIRMSGGVTRVVTVGPNGEVIAAAPPQPQPGPSPVGGAPPPPPYIPPPPPYPGAPPQMSPLMQQKRPLLLQQSALQEKREQEKQQAAAAAQGAAGNQASPSGVLLSDADFERLRADYLDTVDQQAPPQGPPGGAPRLLVAPPQQQQQLLVGPGPPGGGPRLTQHRMLGPSDVLHQNPGPGPMVGRGMAPQFMQQPPRPPQWSTQAGGTGGSLLIRQPGPPVQQDSPLRIPLFNGVAPPAPPVPPEHIASDQDRLTQFNYEQWLNNYKNFADQQLKYYEAEMTKVRKQRKSLNSKQRSCRKNGNELPDHDAMELQRLTTEGAALQKHLDAARKAVKQHATLVQEYQNKQRPPVVTSGPSPGPGSAPSPHSPSVMMSPQANMSPRHHQQSPKIGTPLSQGEDSNAGFSPTSGGVQDMLRSPVGGRLVGTPSPGQGRSMGGLSRPLGVTSPGTQEQLLRLAQQAQQQQQAGPGIVPPGGPGTTTRFIRMPDGRTRPAMLPLQIPGPTTTPVVFRGQQAGPAGPPMQVIQGGGGQQMIQQQQGQPGPQQQTIQQNQQLVQGQQQLPGQQQQLIQLQQQQQQSMMQGSPQQLVKAESDGEAFLAAVFMNVSRG